MSASRATITAARVAGAISENTVHPAAEWERAEPVQFSSDWQGRDSDPALTTEVRVLWSPGMLYLRFRCHYRELFVFEDADSSGRRDHLWDRDVAEAFLQPPDGVSPGSLYKELEVAPNGMWIDLDVSNVGLKDLQSGLARSVHVNPAEKLWTAELAIPMQALTTNFKPAPWRANFYRIEGRTEPRHYLAWQPTHTAEPNFHVPEAFGELRFSN